MTTLPTIHLNGDSIESLRESHMKAYEALTDAINAAAEACPNSRNYYPQGNSSFLSARDEHVEILRNLYSAKSHFENLLVHLDEQEELRKSMRKS